MTNVHQRVLADLRDSRDELLRLLRSLVRTHPLYGSAGQGAALELAATHLTGSDLSVSITEADMTALAASPHYVDVTSFGGEFSDYGTQARSGLSASRIFGTAGPHIVLNGHVDVEFVTSPQGWAQEGLWSSGALRHGRMYGRGTSDMLGGVACYLHTLRILSPYLDAAAGAVTVQLVLDEEIGGNGTLWQLMRLPDRKPDVAIIAEPTGGRVCGRTRGFHQLSVACWGDPVHMVFSREHDNAVRLAADVILTLEELNHWVAGQVTDPAAARFVMGGTVHGGTDAAVPASEVEIGVTFALPPQVAPRVVEDNLVERLHKLTAVRPPELRPYGLSFPGSSLTDEGLISGIVAAGREVGVGLADAEFPSACDARLFEAFGIPTVVYGPGSLERAHGCDEYVSVRELEEYCAVLATVLLTTWGVR